MMETGMSVVESHDAHLVEVSDTPQQMAVKLADMKAKLDLVQQFFKDIMVQGQDYGVIPGTDKPTLLKPGAEKLCELYGYAPVIKQVEEVAERDTGFYRARVTVALVHRRTGIVIAEGVGEANTMEGRYRIRWVPEWKLPKGINKENLHSEEREKKDGTTFRMYRMENDDPWTLWNTVLKMAKKRGIIDATLSATRSSGLFAQDIEDLADWVSMGGMNGGNVSKQKPSQESRTNKPSSGISNAQIRRLYAIANKHNVTPEMLKAWADAYLGGKNPKELSRTEYDELCAAIEDGTVAAWYSSIQGNDDTPPISGQPEVS